MLFQAVIGAGAGGLAAGRELLQEGHRINIFELGSTVGGTWNYTEDREEDLLGRRHVYGEAADRRRVDKDDSCHQRLWSGD